MRDYPPPVNSSEFLVINLRCMIYPAKSATSSTFTHSFCECCLLLYLSTLLICFLYLFCGFVVHVVVVFFLFCRKISALNGLKKEKIFNKKVDSIRNQWEGPKFSFEFNVRKIPICC